MCGGAGEDLRSIFGGCRRELAAAGRWAFGVAVGEGEVWLTLCRADDGEGAALACADLLEDAEVFGSDGEDVAFLGLVAPGFERA